MNLTLTVFILRPIPWPWRNLKKLEQHEYYIQEGGRLQMNAYSKTKLIYLKYQFVVWKQS